MSDEIECKIISMFGIGMSYLDIAGHLSEIYGLDISNATISAVTDKLIPEIKLWQPRVDGLSTDRSSALCDSPNPQFPEVYGQQKPEEIHGRPEAGL